jgi:hypothetical protein
LVACFCALLLLACRITDKGNAETWAIGSIVAVHAAEDRFHSLSGRYGTLGELGSAEGNLIGRDLAEGSSHGYYFVVSVTKAGYVVPPTRTLGRKVPGDRSTLMRLESYGRIGQDRVPLRAMNS